MSAATSAAYWDLIEAIDEWKKKQVAVHEVSVVEEEEHGNKSQ